MVLIIKGVRESTLSVGKSRGNHTHRKQTKQNKRVREGGINLSGCARVRCSLVDLIIGQFFSTSNRAWCRPFAHGFPLPLPAPNFGGSNESGVLYGFTFVKIFHLVSQDLLLPFVKFLSLCFTYKLNPVCHFASPSRLLQPSSLLCWSVSV